MPAPAFAGRVRIIGGRLRGSKLDVADRPGLRPTADRVRETLFNWLQPVLPGARCLDLFAGSGALGFEAISRGAAACVLVERDPALAHHLRETAVRLKIGNATIVDADAQRWLAAGPSHAFDIVFVDPPFELGLHAAMLERLPPALAPQAWIYLESPRDAPFPTPPDWRMHREGHTREVRYALYRRDAPATLAAAPEPPPPTT